MKTRTATKCEDCIHKNVCARLNKPNEIIDAINNFNPCDDNGIDIVISCIDFERVVSRPRALDL